MRKETRSDQRVIRAICVLVTVAASIAGCRGASSPASATACSMKSLDQTSDLSFTFSCPVGGGGWRWCSNGCPANLNIGTAHAPGQCDRPTGELVTCRFEQGSTGKAFSKHLKQLEPGATSVQLFASGHGERGAQNWTFDIDYEHGEQMIGMVANWAKASATTEAATQAANQAQVAAAKQVKEDEYAQNRARLDSECAQGNAESCKSAAWTFGMAAAGSTGATRQQNQATSVQYLRRACDLKNASACDQVYAIDHPAPVAAQESQQQHRCDDCNADSNELERCHGDSHCGMLVNRHYCDCGKRQCPGFEGLCQ